MNNDFFFKQKESKHHNHINFTSIPHKFHTLLSLYYIQPCKNHKKSQFTFPMSETMQESSNDLLMFTESHHTFLLLLQKEKQTHHERSITPVVSKESVDSR